MTNALTAVADPERSICPVAAELLQARDDEVARVDRKVEEEGMSGTEFAVQSHTDVLAKTLPLSNIVSQCASCENNGTITGPDCAVKEQAVNAFVRSAIEAVKSKS